MKEIPRVPDALVFRAPFNRPNLHYKVRLKPESQAENMALLSSLVLGRYQGQSGIIYTTTTKEVETIVTELKSRGVRAGPYHAQMEPPEARSRVHRKWVAGDIQVRASSRKFHRDGLNNLVKWFELIGNLVLEKFAAALLARFC